MFDRLGDRVATWFTHNEPWCQAFLGHATGHHAPGGCDWSAGYQVAHHLLLSHGLAVQAVPRERGHGRIGIALNPQWYVAASDDDADRAARDRVWANSVELFLDPIVHGRYPEALMTWIGPACAGRSDPGDLETIHQPIDLLGVNYYNAETISFDVDGSLLKARSEPRLRAGLGPHRDGLGDRAVGSDGRADSSSTNVPRPGDDDHRERLRHR